MSTHVEWSTASNLTFEMAAPNTFEDESGNPNEDPALIIGADNFFVIEGTPTQIREALERALNSLDSYEDNISKDEDDLYGINDTLTHIANTLDFRPDATTLDTLSHHALAEFKRSHEGG